MLSAFPEIDATDIQAVLDRAGHRAALRRLAPAGGGTPGRVWLVATDQDEFILHLFSREDAAWKPAKEVAVYAQMRAIGIPAPEILDADVSHEARPGPYVLSTRLPGQPLSGSFWQMADDERAAVCGQLGDIMGRLHACTYPICGDLAGDGSVGPARELAADGARSGPFRSWIEMMRAIVEGHVRVLRRSAFADVIGPVEAWMEERFHVIDYPVTPRLLHLDLHTGNVLAQGHRITAILDVEHSLVGHAEYDLMRTELAFLRGEDASLSEAFLMAYGPHTALDDGYAERKPFYEMSRQLVGLRWALRQGDYADPDQTAATRRAVQRLLAE